MAFDLTPQEYEAIEWHEDRDACDHCGKPATHHYLSAGFSDELNKLEEWEHHKDLCDECDSKKG